MHGEHSEQSIIVNAYLSCGRARTHDLQSVATCLTLSLTTSRGIQCDRSARYKDKGVLQTLVIDLIYWWCELIEKLIRS